MRLVCGHVLTIPQFNFKFNKGEGFHECLFDHTWLNMLAQITLGNLHLSLQLRRTVAVADSIRTSTQMAASACKLIRISTS